MISSAVRRPSNLNNTSPCFMATRQGSFPTWNLDPTFGHRSVSIATMDQGRSFWTDTSSFRCSLQGPQLVAVKTIKTGSSPKFSIICSTFLNCNEARSLVSGLETLVERWGPCCCRVIVMACGVMIGVSVLTAMTRNAVAIAVQRNRSKRLNNLVIVTSLENKYEGMWMNSEADRFDTDTYYVVRTTPL